MTRSVSRRENVMTIIIAAAVVVWCMGSVLYAYTQRSEDVQSQFPAYDAYLLVVAPILTPFDLVTRLMPWRWDLRIMAFFDRCLRPVLWVVKIFVRA